SNRCRQRAAEARNAQAGSIPDGPRALGRLTGMGMKADRTEADAGQAGSVNLGVAVRRLPRFGFLLAAMLAELTLAVQRWRPGSFAVPAAWTVGPTQDLRSSLMYFSFATLTTLGYGDIHPSDVAAGTLCASEALLGQLYLAIMIARMVGLHTSQRSGS